MPKLSPSNPDYDPWSVQAVSRPTIKSFLNYNHINNIVTQNTIRTSGGGTLNLWGVIIDSIPENDEEQLTDWGRYNSAPIYGDTSSVVVFRGCYFVTKQPVDNFYKWVIAANLAEGNIPALKFNRCIMLSGEYFVSLGGSAASLSITDDWPIQYAFEYLKGNLVQATKDGKLSGIVRGPGGEPRNLMINFVV